MPVQRRRPLKGLSKLVTRSKAPIGARPESLDAAEQFLLYKVAAIEHLQRRVLGVAPHTWVTDLSRREEGGIVLFPPRHKYNDEATFQLHLALDAYLFHACSVWDALAQLFNLVFRLGYRPKDVDSLKLVQALSARMNGAIPSLDQYTELRQDRASWLGELYDLRNSITHRSLLTPFPARIDFRIQDASKNRLFAIVGLEHRQGRKERLSVFLDRSRRGTLKLLETILSEADAALER